MRILELQPKSGFSLFLRFDNGTSGNVDLSDLAGKGVFTSWLEPGIFEQAKITDAGAVEWPGDIDLCPDSLYMRLTGKAPNEVFPALRKLSTRA